MSTKAYYPISEIGAGKPGFSKTRSIIEAAFYGNNVVKVNTLKEAYELAKNSPGTVVTDMPVYRGEEFGLEKDAKVLLFNDGAITGRYATARRIAGEPGVDCAAPISLRWTLFTNHAGKLCITQRCLWDWTLSLW